MHIQSPGWHEGYHKLPDGFDHAEAHFHTAVSVVLPGLRKSRNTVVAVPQDFNAKAVMLLKETELKCCVRRRISSSKSLRKKSSRVKWSGEPTLNTSTTVLF